MGIPTPLSSAAPKQPAFFRVMSMVKIIPEMNSYYYCHLSVLLSVAIPVIIFDNWDDFIVWFLLLTIIIF